jgi:hypothetical protein
MALRIQAHSKFHPTTIHTRLSENDLPKTQNTTHLIMLIKIQPKNTSKHPKNTFFDPSKLFNIRQNAISRRGMTIPKTLKYVKNA